MKNKKIVVAIVISVLLWSVCCYVFFYSNAEIKNINSELMREAQNDLENLHKDNNYLTGLLEKHEAQSNKK